MLFLEHLLSEGAPKLETIQVALTFDVDLQDYMKLFVHLWRALPGSNGLRNLNIVFEDCEEKEFNQRVLMLFIMGEETCLPSLETLGYSLTSYMGGGPSSYLGSPLARLQGARTVCTQIGRMVAEGALPSLKQVNMYLGPDEAGNALVGAGPRLEEAPHVECFFLPQPDGWQNGELTWLRPSHLNAELQCRVLAALTNPLDIEKDR